MPKSALRTNWTVERCTSRTTSSTSAAPMLTDSARLRLLTVSQVTVNRMVGTAASAIPRRPPSALASSPRGLNMIGTSPWRPMQPATVTDRPGSTPVMRRRPSHTTVMTPEPSSSSASRAGTPPRGRSVTVRSTPLTTTCSRSGASAMARASSVACDWRRSRWWASELSAQRESAWRNRLFSAMGSPDPAGVVRQRDRQRLAHGHRLVAASYDDLGERVLPVGGGVGVDGRLAEEGGAQHPPLAVDADDARGLGRSRPVGALHRHLADQLGAPAALALGGLAAAPLHVGSDLRADLGPQVTVAGGREGLELAGAVGAGQHDRPDLAALLVDLQPELAVGDRGHEDRAEVGPVDAVALDLGHVERAGGGVRAAGGVLSGAVRGRRGRVGLAAELHVSTPSISAPANAFRLKDANRYL